MMIHNLHKFENDWMKTTEVIGQKLIFIKNHKQGQITQVWISRSQPLSNLNHNLWSYTTYQSLVQTCLKLQKLRGGHESVYGRTDGWMAL